MKKKWWFFSKYFSLKELVNFCYDNNIHNPRNIINNKFLLSPDPHLLALFHYGDPDLDLVLDKMQVEDQKATSILFMPDDGGVTSLLIAKENKLDDVYNFLLRKGADENILNQGIRCQSEASIRTGVAKNRIMTFLIPEVDFHALDIPVVSYSVLGKTIQESPQLKKLGLFGKEIGVKGAKSIAEGLLNNTTLTSLNIGKNKIGCEGIKSIAAALDLPIARLTYLDISENEISSQGIISLSAVLQKSIIPLTFLSLNKNQINDYGISELSKSLWYNTTLTELHLSFNTFGGDGCSAFSIVLERNTTLKALYLAGSKLTNHPIGARHLCEALQKNNTLTLLDLSDDKIEDLETSILAKVLNSGSITSLNLSKNHISRTGVSELSTCLLSNTCLVHLDLGYNRISDSGATTLAETLKLNTILTHIDLSCNHLGPTAASAISALVVVNKTLQFINLKENAIGNNGAAELITAMQNNTTITNFSIEKNGMFPNLNTAFQKIISSNKEKKEKERIQAVRRAIAIVNSIRAGGKIFNKT